MRKSNVIFLSVLIAVLVAIIVAGVMYLYSGVEPEIPSEGTVVVENSQEGESPAANDQTPVKDDAPAKDASQEEQQQAAQTEAQQAAPAATEPAKPATNVRTFKVTNCKTHKKNTLRQNADNSIELIDEKGTLLWKKNMDGPIVGNVTEVDYYKNGKIQFKMEIAGKIHLIDRLGREVNGFPKNE